MSRDEMGRGQLKCANCGWGHMVFVSLDDIESGDYQEGTVCDNCGVKAVSVKWDQDTLEIIARTTNSIKSVF